ncbi:MAG: arylsulfatase [Candidatus Pacebacteria bacterium]|nr:arylsulfatase [Candidatus Paceibacterota bacterium]
MTTNRPNIVYILADDMGYGDVSCFNEDGKLQTGCLDQLAEEGVVFRHAHANSAVCTPTRYGIMTGRYCWRSRLKSGVVFGYTPSLLENDRMTVARFLKKHGYRTACFGKWHLGIDWAKDGEEEWEVDFTKPVRNGPSDLGFDYYFGISASLDMPPYVYLENDRVTQLPDGISRNVDSKGYWREGPIAPDFRHVEVLPELTRRVTEYIHRQANNSEPFFLYFPMPAPHTPILPTERFVGSSNTNAYGDFVLQVDDTVGSVMRALHESGQSENTLVIYTSDNGCSPMANFEELASVGHNPSYKFRGHKADIFEGGHRIPFIARWPARIPAGSVSDEIICLTDLMRTCAAIVDDRLPANAGEDSFNILPALVGDDYERPLRPGTVLHSINGSFAIREGNWKLEMCPGSGGWSEPRPDSDEVVGLPPIQLYDLAADVGETTNVCDDHPEVVNRLRAMLIKYIREGRSTPGETQDNEAVDNWPQLAWMDES